MSSFYPLLVPLAPVIAALFAVLPKDFFNKKNYIVGWWVMFAGFLTSIVLLSQAIQNPEPRSIIAFTTPWEFLPEHILYVDRLSAVMMTVISGFGILVYRYSIRYLQQDAGQSRYQALLALKIATLLFMVTSDDFISLFIAWQLLSWLLSLLFHNYAHLPTAQSSFRTFIILRTGNLAFLAGIVLAYHLYGTIHFVELFERAVANPVVLSFFGTGLEITGVTAVTLLVFIGIISKSAQFPLHVWLPDSMYSPTPVSAMLHAGSINVAGFLLHRLAPLYTLSPTILNFVLFIGLVTAIMGTCMMLVQNDIKKTLAYSTIGQMGYMVMECGVGAFSLAVYHMISHGLFKADLFLSCGKGIHEARLDPSEPKSILKSSDGTSSWIVTFILSFLIPLFITIGVHNLLGISFMDSQGLMILFLFSWVTASQAMITLFRLRKPFSTKGSMLVIITTVSLAYFFLAEQFTHFLIPDKKVVDAYFHAAELPYGLFMILVVLLVSSITIGWFFSICSQEKRDWSKLLTTKAYMFFINRLYLDGIVLRVLTAFKRVGRIIDQSSAIFVVFIAFGLALAFSKSSEVSFVSVQTFTFLLASALLLPLFPFHGVYIAALTRGHRAVSTALCALFPIFGTCVMVCFLPEIPRGLLPVISTLAFFGAFWGSVKALSQKRASHVLAYGGFSLYSILWWHVAQVGRITPQALIYVFTVTLAWSGLFLAWDRIRVRYGNLKLNEIGGLFQPMPRLAFCMGLLIMAAVGLPPFGLFFGYLGILLSPSTGISPGLILIIGTWFAACWYLFKLMQHLLFGPYRKDIRYDDLSVSEVMAFVFVLALLITTSGISHEWLNIGTTEVSWNPEVSSWIQ